MTKRKKYRKEKKFREREEGVLVEEGIKANPKDGDQRSGERDESE